MAGSNCKISRNCVPDVMKSAFMLIGGDVTHPSPEQVNLFAYLDKYNSNPINIFRIQKLIPSVVGVVASFDRNATKYSCSWRLQNPKV